MTARTPPSRMPPSLWCGGLSSAACVALLAAVVSVGACKPQPPPIKVPGKTRDLTLVVKVAGLSAAELGAIGSFTMTSVHDGKADGTFALNYSAAAETLSFLDDPPALPAKGTLQFRFVGNDLSGDPLPVAGSTAVVDLDSIARDGEAQLFALIGHTDSLDDLALLLAPRFNFTATATGTGFVVVGGFTSGSFNTPGNSAVTAEWHDLATGLVCDSAGSACDFGDVPPPRTEHIAVSLGEAFGPDCPERDNALVGLGTNADGSARNDLFVFRPSTIAAGDAGGFERLDGIDVGARSGASAFATEDCRVIITGGVSGANSVTSTKVLTFGAGGIEVSDGPPLPSQRIGAPASPTLNALGEVILVGGADTAAAALDTAATFATAQGRLDVCQSDDDTCNDAVAHLTCARSTPAVAPLRGVADDFPALVVGGNDACAPSELLVSRADAPYTSFVATGGNPLIVRTAGHIATPFGIGRALVAGGIGPASTLDVELVTLGSSQSGQISVQTFSTLPDLRAGLAVVHVGGAVLLVGGTATEPVAEVRVTVPADVE